VTDGDRIVIDQHFLDEQADDPLAFADIEGLRRFVQSLEECRQGFGQAQERHAVGSLIADRLELGAHALFAAPQFGHAAPQLVQGQKVFLIGGDQPLDALAEVLMGWTPPRRRRCAKVVGV
jgi:hypothetical protein